MTTAPNPPTTAPTLAITNLPLQPKLSVPGFCQRFCLQLRYVHNAQRWSLYFIVIGIVLVVVLCLLMPAWNLPRGGTQSAPQDLTDWLSRLQDLVGVMTLFVAIIVWHGEAHEDWENTLPKRMSVFFFGPDGEGKKAAPVIVSRNVWLSGEDDLRQWAMQVAGQAVTRFVPSSNQAQLRLDFGLDVFASQGRVLTDETGQAHKHYTIRFNLARIPQALVDAWRGNSEPLCLYQNLAMADSPLLQVPVTELNTLATQPDWPSADRVQRNP